MSIRIAVLMKLDRTVFFMGVNVSGAYIKGKPSF